MTLIIFSQCETEKTRSTKLNELSVKVEQGGSGGSPLSPPLYYVGGTDRVGAWTETPSYDFHIAKSNAVLRINNTIHLDSQGGAHSFFTESVSIGGSGSPAGGTVLNVLNGDADFEEDVTIAGNLDVDAGITVTGNLLGDGGIWSLDRTGEGGIASLVLAGDSGQRKHIETKDAGDTTWQFGENTSGQWVIRRFVGGSFSTTPVTIDDATGMISFSHDLNITGNLDVTGVTTLVGDFDVTGATTIDGTVDIDGATTISMGNLFLDRVGDGVDAQLYIDSDAGQRSLIDYRENGVTMFEFGKNNTNQFLLRRFSGGVWQDNPVTFQTTGVVLFAHDAFFEEDVTLGTDTGINRFLVINSSGIHKAQVRTQNAGVTTWEYGSDGDDYWNVDRYVAGSYVDTPLQIDNATGDIAFIHDVEINRVGDGVDALLIVDADATDRAGLVIKKAGVILWEWLSHSGGGMTLRRFSGGVHQDNPIDISVAGNVNLNNDATVVGTFSALDNVVIDSTVSSIDAELYLNADAGDQSALILQKNGVTLWKALSTVAGGFSLQRYSGGVLQDSPIQVGIAGGLTFTGVTNVDGGFNVNDDGTLGAFAGIVDIQVDDSNPYAILMHNTAQAQDWGFWIDGTGDFIIYDDTTLESRLAIDTSGHVTVYQTMDVLGDFEVGTNAFMVDESNGNVSVNFDVSLASDRFSVVGAISSVWDDDPDDYIRISRTTGSVAQIQASVPAGGTARFRFDAVTTGHSYFEFFRSTNTTSNKSIDIYEGLGSANQEHQIGVDDRESYWHLQTQAGMGWGVDPSDIHISVRPEWAFLGGSTIFLPVFSGTPDVNHASVDNGVVAIGGDASGLVLSVKTPAGAYETVTLAYD